jgi:hypothetical protein
MRARSARLKGHLIIDSQVGRGTIVKMNWPAERQIPLADRIGKTEVIVST